jgi:hypothetical protein
VKVALPVVRGLHGSRTEGTIRRFKVGDFKTEFNGLGVLRTDTRMLIGGGPDADRRAKLLIYRMVDGSILGSDSLLVQRSACRGWHSG